MRSIARLVHSSWRLLAALAFLLGVLPAAAQSDDACTIETVAGGGTMPAGADGPALRAELLDPAYVVQGPDGLIYFADRGFFRIRRVTADGMISSPELPWRGIFSQEIPSSTLSVDALSRVLAFDPSQRFVYRLDDEGGFVGALRRIPFGVWAMDADGNPYEGGPGRSLVRLSADLEQAVIAPQSLQ